MNTEQKPEAMQYRHGAPAQTCTCPSGDGSLRWPCPAHPPSAAPVVLPEPFGYFKPFIDGWMDCKETDEGARPLYEAPRPQAAAQTAALLEREAFEVWWRENVSQGLAEIDSDYRYWALWQASAAIAKATGAASSAAQPEQGGDV